jgi:carboxypeptidase family protein
LRVAHVVDIRAKRFTWPTATVGSTLHSGDSTAIGRRIVMIDRGTLAIVILTSCLAGACAGDTSLVSPSSTSMSSSSDALSTITGRVTARKTQDGIAGAKVMVQAGTMRGASAVTDASGFYTVAVKTGHVQVLVRADKYIDRSEVIDVSNSNMRVDFQLMPAIED